MPCPASNSCARGGAQALSDTTKKNSCSRIRGCSLQGGCPKCALVGGAGFGWYSNQCILTVGSLSGGSDMLWNVADGEIRWGLRQVEMPVLFPVHDWQKMAHRGFSICRCRCAMQKTSKQNADGRSQRNHLYKRGGNNKNMRATETETDLQARHALFLPSNASTRVAAGKNLGAAELAFV